MPEFTARDIAATTPEELARLMAGPPEQQEPVPAIHNERVRRRGVARQLVARRGSDGREIGGLWLPAPLTPILIHGESILQAWAAGFDTLCPVTMTTSHQHHEP